MKAARPLFQAGGVWSGHETRGPLAYCNGGGSQLFVFVTLENAIHIFVLGDNLDHFLAS